MFVIKSNSIFLSIETNTVQFYVTIKINIYFILKSIVNKLIIILFFLSLVFSRSYGQESDLKKEINWKSDSIKSDKNVLNFNSAEFPRFNPVQFGALPMVYLKFPVSTLNNVVTIKLVKLSGAILSFGDTDEKLIKNNIQLNYQTVIANKKPYLLISFLPILKQNGGLQKVDAYDIEINGIQQLSVSNNLLRSYANNSVLASGNWYKIAVKDEGIYKLSFDFLRNLGIDLNTLNPKNIRVYGNGGAPLPQNNLENRFDDLQENAIQVVGEADGKFDNTDYVLFYASGNIKWKQNLNNPYFEHKSNDYTDSSYYFINVDKGVGKRINSINNNAIPSNYNTNEYNDYQLYEKDFYTLVTSSIKSGRVWYGEDFEFSTSRNFDFNSAGIVLNAPAFIKTNMVLRANTISSASVKVNNQVLYNLQATALPLNFETDFARPVQNVTSINTLTGNTLTVNINYNKPNSTANAWLDFIEVNFRRQLILSQSFLKFRDLNSIANDRVTQFTINNVNTGVQFWDVTNGIAPVQQNVDLIGSTASFNSNTNILREFVAFSPTAFKEPVAFGKIANQNLHALPQADLIILSDPQWLNEAKRLGDFRKAEQNLSYHIVTPAQIFNEFSSGGREATAIRDFMKMFYDRANFNPLLGPKYLLLFGKGSFDNRMLKFKENNFIVTYQSENSISPTQSYTSDDYFGLLDDIEGDFPEDFVNNPGLLDVAVGRIPVKSVSEAKDVVDKLISYADSKSFGDWRNQFTIVADDEDNNLHLNQAEANAALILSKTNNPNIDKIYFDAYKQESGAGGNSYPEVEVALNQKVNNGTLLINYTGHGGESGWAEERVLTLKSINNWNNPLNLPIIFTATCSFSRWDDPEITSGGELALLKKSAGVPGLFSTTRIVFASYNFDLNQSFLRAMFNPTSQNKKVTFGSVFKEAKNNNIGGLNINSRNFTLLGDPSTLFPIPINKIATTSINSKTAGVADTLRAGQKVNIKGIITNESGVKLTNFNGFIFPSVYDKPNTITTLGQDRQINGSYTQTFMQQKNIIYKGKATVNNGDFSFDFIIPKDINLQIGKGKLSYYADDALIDATGNNMEVNIGGISTNFNTDVIGPDINIFLNDEKFVSGGITNTNPTLLVKLKDQSGINTTGIGIGHDIVATLSFQNKKDQTIILNEFYQATLDSYQQGVVTYPITNLEAGLYTLKLKAWDVFNNSSEQTVTFEVRPKENLEIAHVLNYPNPFTTQTSFQFEHNQPNQDLEVQINIKTISGKLIKTINQSVNSLGNRVNNIFWDGRDDFGEKIGRGVYIYELKVRSVSSGKSIQKIEKLVLL